MYGTKRQPWNVTSIYFIDGFRAVNKKKVGDMCRKGKKKQGDKEQTATMERAVLVTLDDDRPVRVLEWLKSANHNRTRVFPCGLRVCVCVCSYGE